MSRCPSLSGLGLPTQSAGGIDGFYAVDYAVRTQRGHDESLRFTERLNDILSRSPSTPEATS